MAVEGSWDLHPAAQSFVEDALAEAVAASPRLAGLAADILQCTGTRLTDWVDHLGGPWVDAALRPIGYAPSADAADGIWWQPAAQLPGLVPQPGRLVGLRADDVDQAAACLDGVVDLPEHRFGELRVAGLTGPDDASVALDVVERRSRRWGVQAAEVDPDHLLNARLAWDCWDTLPRSASVEVGLTAAVAAAQDMVELVGPDIATSIAFEHERARWQRRSRAGRVQHVRQQRFGLGWGNADHHTFRSSRAAFGPLMEVLGAFGFAKRERFWAGDEAGWGAQVLEHPGNGTVVFADVDLTPDEVAVDFTKGLDPAPDLGTIGLWCALHGESILDAGLHHLAISCDFDRARAHLAALDVVTMAPFSDLPHLRQAFTVAEPWVVNPLRLAPLVGAGHITEAQAATFFEVGAPGSHLEVIQRGDGFKGFNQQNVSATMRATDPRVL